MIPASRSSTLRDVFDARLLAVVAALLALGTAHAQPLRGPLPIGSRIRVIAQAIDQPPRMGLLESDDANGLVFRSVDAGAMPTTVDFRLTRSVEVSRGPGTHTGAGLAIGALVGLVVSSKMPGNECQGGGFGPCLPANKIGVAGGVALLGAMIGHRMKTEKWLRVWP
jgi:hypothetical protein